MPEELSKDSHNVTVACSEEKYQENCGKPAERTDSAEVSEGGWGYVVVFAFSIILILLQGLSNSFGILFHDFLRQHDDKGQHAVVIFITSINIGIAVSGIGSVLTNIALKKFTIRQTALCGTLVILTGDLLAVFMTAPFHLIITYGILKGLGLGVLMSLSFLVLNSYFIKKRISMTSLAQTSVCLGGMIFPMAITALLENYGFRGCMLIIFGLDLHLIFAVLLLVPAKPVLQPFKPRIDRSNLSVEPPTSVTLSFVITVIFIIYSKLMSTKSLSGKLDIMESSFKKEHQETLKRLIEQKENIPAVGRTNNAIGKIEELNESFWSKMMKYFNLNFLADPIFVNIAVGLSLTFFADGNFKLIEPLILYSYRLKESQVAICITAGGIADFVSRFSMAIITLYIRVSPRLLYFIVLSLSCAARLVFLISENYIFVTVMTAIIGFVRSWLAVLYALVIASYVTPDKFPAAYGLLVMITGITMSIGGPITGIIHTITEDYIFVVYALSLCNAISIITWSIEYFCTRKYNTEALDKNKHTLTTF